MIPQEQYAIPRADPRAPGTVQFHPLPAPLFLRIYTQDKSHGILLVLKEKFDSELDQ